MLTGRRLNEDMTVVGPYPTMMENADGQRRQPKPTRCPWPACAASSPIGNKTLSREHFQTHERELLAAWAVPTNCSWPRSPSKGIFTDRGGLRRHITNIHVQPLLCNIEDCKHIKPFGTHYDLNRHISTMHQKLQEHKCSVHSCDASTTGFARKDKLLQHIREKHPNVRCSLSHYRAIVLAGDEEKLLQNHHGPYECAAGACEHASLSQFSQGGLLNHLRAIHGQQ